MTALPSSGALYALLAAFGLIFGSFVTALSYRLPRGESVAHGRSHCPACGHVLAVPDLIPVLSWALNKGACRHCRTRVSWRYPAIEMLSAALFVGAGALAPDIPHLVLLLAMTPIMLALAIIDIEHQRLPNSLLLPLAILAVAWRWEGDKDFLTGMIAAAVTLVLGFGLDAVHKAISGRLGLGMGDTKLLAIAALALPLPVFLACAGMAGTVAVVIGLLSVRPAHWRTQMTFGPAILASYWAALAAGSHLIGALLTAA